MITTEKRAGGRRAIPPTLALALAATLASWSGRAEAQYGGYGGFGGFGGFGLGYNPNAYTDVNFLNSRSLVNASAAAASRPQPVQAPQFPTRDDNFYDRYDLSTRESMINRVARDPSREMGTASPSGVAEHRPAPRSPGQPSPGQPSAGQPTTVHLANFFNKDHQIVWPSSAPITGEFGKQQAVADQAALAVLNEYELSGLAQLSTVSDARRKLLDYGRPALDYVRQQSTPALADSFHVFLLSLYGNLGAAATVPRPK